MTFLLTPVLLGGMVVSAAEAAPTMTTRTEAVGESLVSRLGQTAVANARATVKTYRINADGVRQQDGPGWDYGTLSKRLNKSSRVPIRCTVRNAKGELWDKIDPGNVYVLDRYVSTGTSKPVAGACQKVKPKSPPRPVVAPPPPPPTAIPSNSYRHVNHWWYSELLFNRAATAQAARDTQNFCDDLADIPLIGVGEKYFCRTYYLEFRRAAQQAGSQNRCVRWVFGLQLIPKPDTYAGDFCR